MREVVRWPSPFKIDDARGIHCHSHVAPSLTRLPANSRGWHRSEAAEDWSFPVNVAAALTVVSYAVEQLTDT